jgi:hypothetical protein
LTADRADDGAGSAFKFAENAPILRREVLYEGNLPSSCSWHQIMRVISEYLRSLTLRFTFCSQGEHKRVTIDAGRGELRRRCIDCGHSAPLGTVVRKATNRRVAA